MRKVLKKRMFWLILLASILLISVILQIVFTRLHTDESEKIATVSRDGKVVRTIALSEVTAPYEFTVTDSNGGTNTLRVEPGKIAVVAADCPDKICVKQGFICEGPLPIVCLPHRLSVTVSGGGSSVDAVTGGGAP